MRVVSTIKYYKNINILRHTTCLPSYRHQAFPTQILQELLMVVDRSGIHRAGKLTATLAHYKGK